MSRAFLRWFYVGVQFVMLAVSIPKVATLFHAYDLQTVGPLLGGIDLRSWLVGIAIDLTATFTTWAAMAKYEESRKRTALFAPALIILCCTALSVVANYEDAATLAPEQYQSVSLFTHPAILINPVLISAPPVLVLLLILLVPSVLAQPRVKSAAEINAEAEEQEALIAAQARVREARARANAQVMGARLKGVIATVNAATNNTAAATTVPALPEPEVEPQEALPLSLPDLPPAQMTRAMWQAMKLPDRVTQSGVITAQEIAEVLGISLSHARNLIKETGKKLAVPGRSGVDFTALIDALYSRRTKDSFEWARKLEKTLGISKRTKQLHVVPPEQLETEAPEQEAEGMT